MLAAGFLSAESKSWMSSDVRVMTEDSFVDGNRLIAPFDHVDYLDRGREDMQLAGNLPIAVELDTGKCSFITWEETEEFMDRGLL